MAETLEEYKSENESFKKQISFLEKKLQSFEVNGSAKLYYALNRKASEMADVLDKQKLTDISLDDPKDKTFDRLKVIWNDSSSLSSAIKELGIAAGVTGDEGADTKSFSDKLAMDRK